MVFSIKDVTCGNWAVGKTMVGLWGLCASEVAFDFAYSPLITRAGPLKGSVR